LATICIFIRSVYRVVELSEGWRGYLIRQQWLFVGLEGVMVAVGVLSLVFFNPAFCFPEGMTGEGVFEFPWFGSKKTKVVATDEKHDYESQSSGAKNEPAMTASEA